jgi:hypothetical protein
VSPKCHVAIILDGTALLLKLTWHLKGLLKNCFLPYEVQLLQRGLKLYNIITRKAAQRVRKTRKGYSKKG